MRELSRTSNLRRNYLIAAGAGALARAAAPELRRLSRSGDLQIEVDAARALEAVELEPASSEESSEL